MGQLPAGLRPHEEDPFYLLLHGGPHNGVTDAWQPRWNTQIFAGWGYVVAWHNFHGSSGFGQAFTDSINPLQSELPYQDTILAARWFAAKPWIDAKRMAAGGGSFGGYLATVLLGREHPFKTLIAHAAVYDWYTQVGADYGAGKSRHGEFWQKPEIFKTSSAYPGRRLQHADAGHPRTTRPARAGQPRHRAVNALQNRGVKSQLVFYRTNHWILKPNNSLFWYATCRSWLQEILGSGWMEPSGGRAVAGAAPFASRTTQRHR